MNTYHVFSTSGDIDFGTVECNATLPTTGTREARREAAENNPELVKCLLKVIGKRVGMAVRITQITPARKGERLFVGWTQAPQALTVVHTPTPEAPVTTAPAKQTRKAATPAPVQAAVAVPETKPVKAASTPRRPRGMSVTEKRLATMLSHLPEERRAVVLSTVR